MWSALISAILCVLSYIYFGTGRDEIDDIEMKGTEEKVIKSLDITYVTMVCGRSESCPFKFRNLENLIGVNTPSLVCFIICVEPSQVQEYQ